MTTLEQEIIDLYHQLDEDAQRRVRAVIELETEARPAMSHEEWVDFINSLYGSLADDPLEEM